MTREDAQDLVIRAFELARQRGKADWRRMSTAVLKNRILQLTDHTFSERQFGADSFSSFLRLCSGVIRVDRNTRHPTIELLDVALHRPATRKSCDPASASGEEQLRSSPSNPRSALVPPKQKAVEGTAETVVSEVEDVTDRLAAIEDVVSAKKKAGDRLSAGELLSESFKYVGEDEVADVFARIASLWSTAAPHPVLVTKASDLQDNIHSFSRDDLAIAVVHAANRLLAAGKEIPEELTDLVYKLQHELVGTFRLQKDLRTSLLLVSAETYLRQVRAGVVEGVQEFTKTTVYTVRAKSVDLLKKLRMLHPLVLPAERPLLARADTLLGASFRKFCEHCERHDAAQALERSTEVERQVNNYLADERDAQANLPLMRDIVTPIIEHVRTTLSEGVHAAGQTSRPELETDSGVIKLDLSTAYRETTVAVRIRNRGKGTAYAVELAIAPNAVEGDRLQFSTPEPFQLGAGCERIVEFAVTPIVKTESISLPVTWRCEDVLHQSLAFPDELVFEQQKVEPDWDALLLSPPYTLSAVKERSELVGRDDVLLKLTLHLASETSVFLWGQKRVGKTSVLQVLENELQKQRSFACHLMRIGELRSLREGDIAHRIAKRFCADPKINREVPPEGAFGTSLGNLVPFMEELKRLRKGLRFVLIIDEFDDLDRGFYTGDRGKSFIKALRSLSEAGVIFVFVGSEKMNSIYNRHQTDLNRWANVFLDRIAQKDCDALVTQPTSDTLEWQDTAVSRIAKYCAGNPFYMRIICHNMFQRCMEERRTFVSESDVDAVCKKSHHVISKGNFAHFWEDNPELDERTNETMIAENCLVLSLVTRTSGTATIASLIEAQKALGLVENEALVHNELREIVQRLRSRGVLHDVNGHFEVAVPVFADWLSANAENQLLPAWREHAAKRAAEPESVGAGSAAPAAAVPFLIEEEELLAVSQRLVYCGRQKDVSEVRVWLKQFEDDTRIELAFALLKQLAARGYIDQGMKMNALDRVRLQITSLHQGVGGDAKKVVQGRRVNLCVTYVDSEQKSGADTARELKGRLRPGICKPATQLGHWMKTTRDAAFVAIVDDFAGTGETLKKGIAEFRDTVGADLVDRFIAQGQLAVFLLYSFPEAVELLEQEFPKLTVSVANILGDEVRGLHEGAGIFDNEESRAYAHDTMLQIGRELVQRRPLGWGDMGALVVFENTVPNNTLPVFWAHGVVAERQWVPLFPRP